MKHNNMRLINCTLSFEYFVNYKNIILTCAVDFIQKYITN